ncbi:MAG: hypothetical protein Ct9H300mP21_03840 [Pseudomonadota bacterium]|nr:MAG: hypothetical protein Ct9H300mP21_03840 [Pseudomonadota bacterium]
MNFSGKLFKPFLFLTSQIYKALVLLRLHGYKNGWLKSYQPETPVISVGNLTVGGTGKTPVVDFLVKGIQNQKKRPAILSRGYKERMLQLSSGFVFVKIVRLIRKLLAMNRFYLLCEILKSQFM